MNEMTSSRPYLVRAVREWIMENRLTPYILVQMGLPGTHVPEAYVDGDKIVLNISDQAITSFDLDADWLNFVARFGGRSMNVCVPVASIMAIYARENGEGMVFDRVDPSSSSGVTGQARPVTPVTQEDDAHKPHLELVKR